MEGVDVQVETSGVVSGELDAVSCLLFDFKGGGTESGCKKSVLAAVITGKTKEGSSQLVIKGIMWRNCQLVFVNT